MLLHAAYSTLLLSVMDYGNVISDNLHCAPKFPDYAGLGLAMLQFKAALWGTIHFGDTHYEKCRVNSTADAFCDVQR